MHNKHCIEEATESSDLYNENNDKHDKTKELWKFRFFLIIYFYWRRYLPF